MAEIKFLKISTKRLFLFFIAFTVSFSIIYSPETTAQSGCDTDFYSENGVLFYDACDTTCSTTSSIGSQGAVTNTDYSGKPILSEAQLTAITENKSVYETAAKEAGIPWQMIAVIHLRETGLKRSNPTNGQGIYQDTSGTPANNMYPPGDVSDADFLTQTKWAAQFLKNKASDVNALSAGDIAAIKDTFFGYNGRAKVYVDQAVALGFSDKEGYEGSPYVMNKFDAKRDPRSNVTTWGQIKTDGGPLVYPANNDYGAYVVFASLAGISLGDECGVSGELGERVAKIAEQEYALWQSGQMTPGFRVGDASSISKYFNGATSGTDWCAMFTSWVLDQAGHPIVGGSRGSYESLAVGWNDTKKMDATGFVVHPSANNFGGYKPKRGDIVVYEWSGSGSHHVNIIVGYDEATNKITTIGGNEGKTPWTVSYVRNHTRPLSDSQIMSITEVRG